MPTIKPPIKDLIYQVSKPVLGKVRKFHNIHKGDSCYVFGDGISIKSMDLSLFDDKVAIASNYLPLHKEFGKLDCRYCVVAAPYFFSHFFGYESIQRRHMNGMSALYRELIANNPDKNFFFNLSNYPFIGGDNLFYMFKDIPDDRLPADYISKRISCFSGVIHMSILLSIYLGFEHIYLVGFDYTHVPSRNWHWYEKGKGIFRPHEHENYNKDFFAIAKEFIDITTITLDGTSNFINAVTYKEHIGCEPVYRENTELIDERCLKALATWPSYTIY